MIIALQIDLEDIKDVYKKKYGRKLTDNIEEDTSGDYKKLLIKILSPLQFFFININLIDA